MKKPSLRSWWPVLAIAAAVVAMVIVNSRVPAGSVADNAQSGAPAAAIEHLDEASFSDKVLHSAAPVLVDFYAEWCPPCRAMAPVLEEFASENPEAKIVKVNIDENPGLAVRYQIESIPSLLVFRGSQLTGRHVGLTDKVALRQLLSQ
jgi:thioredoxin